MRIKLILDTSDAATAALALPAYNEAGEEVVINDTGAITLESMVVSIAAATGYAKVYIGDTGAETDAWRTVWSSIGSTVPGIVGFACRWTLPPGETLWLSQNTAARSTIIAYGHYHTRS